MLLTNGENVQCLIEPGVVSNANSLSLIKAYSISLSA